MRIGIQQAVTLQAFEQVLSAVLCGDYSLQYAEELARLSTKGEARVKKIRSVINRLATGNPLLPYMKAHQAEVELAMQNANDKKMLFAAVTCATYPFAYQVLCVIGKYLHVQERVTTGLIKGKLAEVYGSVRTLEIALVAVMPMFVEAGLLIREKVGEYAMGGLGNCSDFARGLYKEAFLVNNPTYTRETMDETSPFFEFIRLNNN